MLQKLMEFMASYSSALTPLSAVAALVSAIAALVVAVATLYSVRVARRSLALMEKRDDKSTPHIDLDYRSAKYVLCRGRYIYCVELVVANRSAARNAVVHSDLEVTFVHEERTSPNVSFSIMSEPEILRLIADETSCLRVLSRMTPLLSALPVSIGPYGTLGGWAFYCASERLVSDRAVASRTIHLSDSTGNIWSKDVGFVLPMDDGDDAQEKAQKD